MAKAKNKTKKDNSIVWKGVEVLILLLLILIFSSLMISESQIATDYEIIHKANLTFKDYITLNFPKVENPIGPLGTLISYFFIILFGKFFSISIFVSLSALIILRLFNFDKVTQFKTLLLIFFSFSLENLRYILSDSNVTPKIFNYFITINTKLIGETGALICSVFVLIFSVILMIGISNLRDLFVEFFKLLSKTISEAFTITERIKSEKIKRKQLTIDNKEKKVIKDVEFEEVNENNLIENKPTEPVIKDHANIEHINPIKQNDEQTPQKPQTKKIKKKNIESEYDEYTKPEINEFLADPIRINDESRKELESNIIKISKIITNKLAEFGVEGEVVNVNIGPIITQYEIKPAPGIKVSRFASLSDDLALSIKAKSIRVQAPIPGRGLIGIEVPNPRRDIIFLKDVLLSDEMNNLDGRLQIALGKDIAGNPVVSDLSKTPHLLIAGATGSGKSVCVNTLINSLLLQYTPDELRLIMIDPKRIELSGYEGIPHLIQEVVTEPEDALSALNWGVSEMERRYQLLQKYKVREIKSYNNKISKLKLKDEEVEDIELPYIVMIVDEFADLMMTAGREIEQPIARLAQMARAIGIHLILATQRPSTKVITGVIKANFPARIAFQVSSGIDSRVILDTKGAEKLLGRGDMLFLPPGKGFPERIHGAYMSDDEIENLVEYLKLQPKPEVELTMDEDTELESDYEIEYDDELFPEAAKAVVFASSASVSMLQRHFKIGYARAGRLVDLLEKNGIVGPHVGSKSREVLITQEELSNYGFIQDI